MPTITTRDGVALHVKDWGTGRPVVLLHGWPLSADTFDDLGMAIAGAGMRAIAYDRRGFGRSDQPWSGYDYDTLADRPRRRHRRDRAPAAPRWSASRWAAGKWSATCRDSAITP